MITRRRFLQAAALLGAPAAAGGVLWFDPLTALAVRAARRFDGLVRSPEARLRAHFDYLTLDAQGITEFFAAFERLRTTTAA